MPRCESCGTEQNSLTEVMIDSAILNVCDECKELGKVIEDTSNDSDSNDTYTNSAGPDEVSSRSTSSRKKAADLRVDYGEVLREARRDQNLSLKEVANELNEKASYLRSIENSERQPTEELQQKLERYFEISLSSTDRDVEYDSGESSELTLGDKVDLDEL